MTNMVRWSVLVGLSLLLSLGARAQQPTLDEGFANPPDSTKPWVYWYWISDNISKAGITADLEAMRKVGIGEALIGNIFLGDENGKVKALTEQWWGMVEHAIREGGRTGVNIGMFNCPGWSQSGGPWIKPQQAMRYLVSSEVHVQGPARFEGKLPAPAQPFQDVAVLAFPEPADDTDTIRTHAPRVTSTPASSDLGKLLDGRTDTSAPLPFAGGISTIDLTVDEPFTARSLSLVPSAHGCIVECELQAAENDGTFRAVRKFRFDRSNMGINVGPMPRGPVTVSFAATTSKHFRLVFTSPQNKPELAEIVLSGAARLERYVEKQLGKMHPTPQPMWDTYLWPTQAEPDGRQLTIAANAVQNLTNRLAPDGTLKWEVPAGRWIIVRTGMTPTGTRNGPASAEGSGLEVDKMNRTAAKEHFDAYIGQLLKRMPADQRKALKQVVADSYEMGSENWTDDFADAFRKQYGYDPTPWLPVLTGRIVSSADQSERFLWDLRRLVADRVATEYVGGLREQCEAHGLGLWLENYGHWGFPSEFLKYGGQSDRIGGEFWVTGDLGSIECRAASSAANTYGMPIVSAEAFTGGPPFQDAPRDLKARGDWAFCEGINHFVLHVYIHQPWSDRVPGVNAWFGTEFNRNNTWFAASKAWIDYLRRCCFLLQQGTRVADVAYFIGDDAPKMTGERRPALPPGFDFDYINSDVILRTLSVRDGMLVLPHGTRYRVLVLPEESTMRPEVLRKIRDLVAAGATVLGPAPQRSPSMQDFPACDAEVRQLAAELWGDAPPASGGERALGKGRVMWGRSLETVLAQQKLRADFRSSVPLRYTHRSAPGAQIYFVANPAEKQTVAMLELRAPGMRPELFWPVTGEIETPAVFAESDGCVRLPVELGPHGSVFVVFRSRAESGGVVSVSRDGKTLVDAGAALTEGQVSDPALMRAGVSESFTMAGWVAPAAATTLLGEFTDGIHGLGQPRNSVFFPPHGDSIVPGGGHAGSGLDVGTNGIAVLEHGAGYFVPVLSYPVAIDGWRHVAVVFREGRPTLYIDGRRVHAGVKGKMIVHPGVGNSAGGSPFQGRRGEFTVLPEALDDQAVAKLMAQTPRPRDHPAAAAVKLTLDAEGKLVARFREPGAYALRWADGTTRTLKAPTAPDPVALTGAWRVAFAAAPVGPGEVAFDRLADWSKRPEKPIRHYSGGATYRKAFDLPAEMVGRRVVLDLGRVSDLARVRLNGRDLGTLWMTPWQLDATSALKPGRNELEVTVINVWNNRLVGDAALPEKQRRTWLTAQTVNANFPLMPAGLLGPVMLRAE